MTEHDEPTKEELYEKAQELDIDGRSTMDKAELAEAVAAAESADGEESGHDESESTEAAASDDTAGGFQPSHSEEDLAAQADTEIEPDEVRTVTDTGWVVKSRAEEEAEQHARREARDAEIEQTVAEAKRTPF